MFAAALQLLDADFEALHDPGAVLLARFDLIQLLHLCEHPLRVCAFRLSLKKFPPHVLQTACEFNASGTRRAAGEGLIGLVAVARLVRYTNRLILRTGL